jgi:hypothetical protein
MADNPERFNDPSHPPPITPQQAVGPTKMHNHEGATSRAPFLPPDHISARHGLKPVQD